jgi:hypothetical protein
LSLTSFVLAAGSLIVVGVVGPVPSLPHSEAIAAPIRQSIPAMHLAPAAPVPQPREEIGWPMTPSTPALRTVPAHVVAAADSNT